MRCLKKFFKFIMYGVILFAVAITVLIASMRSGEVTFSMFMWKQNQLNAQNPSIYAKAKQEWVPYQNIPQTIKVAVIAAEDQRFPQHFGLDVKELSKVMSEAVPSRGASTITQQTVKNIFLWNGRSYVRKALEVPLSLLVEVFWTKTRILEVYLNIAQFGPGLYGVQSAANFFYGKNIWNLSNDQQMILACVLPNPSVSDVHNPSEKLLNRKRWVEQQFRNLGGINYLSQIE